MSFVLEVPACAGPASAGGRSGCTAGAVRRIGTLRRAAPSQAQRGVAAVEFAFVLPLLLTVLLAVIELGVVPSP